MFKGLPVEADLTRIPTLKCPMLPPFILNMRGSILKIGIKAMAAARYLFSKPIALTTKIDTIKTAEATKESINRARILGDNLAYIET